MQKKYNGAENKMYYQIIRLGIAVLVMGMLLPYTACTNSGVGEKGQPCSKFGVCVDSMENVDNPDLHIICCPNTSTCIPESECYDEPDPILRGDEGQWCYEDRTCNLGLLCCGDTSPPLCTQPNDCETVDGDDEEDPDGDLDEIVDGDLDQQEAEEEVEEEYEINFPDYYNGTVCSTSDICWALPWPSGFDLNAIWSSKESLWIAGNNGTLINSDKETFNGISAEFNFNLKGISGVDDENVWAVGENKTVLKFNGTKWEKIEDPVFDTKAEEIAFNDVLLDGIGNTYIIGEKGLLFRNLNNKWEQLGSSTNTASLNDMWAIPQEIYVIVGDSGKTIFSYDQNDFSGIPSSSDITTNDLKGVWGLDKDNIFAVGDNGTTLYFDGTKWWDFSDFAFVNEESEIEMVEEMNDLTAVGGFDSSKIFIVGEAGTVYKLIEGINPTHVVEEDAEPSNAPEFVKNHYWFKVQPPEVDELLDIVITQYGEIYVVGKAGTVWATADGESWQVISRKPPKLPSDQATSTGNDFYDVTAMNGKGSVLYSAYSDGQVFYIDYGIDNPEWKAATTVLSSPAKDAWVNTDGKAYFFNDRIFVYDTAINVLKEDADANIVGGVMERAWGFEDGKMYAVGKGVVNYNTITWNRVTTELTVEWNNGIADGDVDTEADAEIEIVGACEIGDSVSCFEWRSVWGKISDEPWLVGFDGRVARRTEDPNNANTFVWELTSLGSNLVLTDIWGDDSDDLWITGTLGALWHFDGNGFTALTVADKVQGEDFLRIWGAGPNNLFILSSIGNIYYSTDGSNFSQYKSGIDYKLNEVWGNSNSNMYFAGENGTLLNAIDTFAADGGKKK